MLKKATIKLDEDVYEKLRDKARRDNVSLSSLVREAVAACYGVKTQEDKIASLEKLKCLELPTGDPEDMENQIIKGVLDK